MENTFNLHYCLCKKSPSKRLVCPVEELISFDECYDNGSESLAYERSIFNAGSTSSPKLEMIVQARTGNMKRHQ